MDHRNSTESVKLNQGASTSKQGTVAAPQVAPGGRQDGLFTSLAGTSDAHPLLNGPVPMSPDFTRNASSTASPVASGSGTECPKSASSSVKSAKVNSCSSVNAASTSGQQEVGKRENGLQVSHVIGQLIPNQNRTPSTSGLSRSHNSEPVGIVRKENRKRPSSLQLNQVNYNVDSSSDTENEDYSLGSEDGCIYTYRGGEHLADLPSSFFSLDMGLPLDKHLPIPPNYVRQEAAPIERPRSRAESPDDMEFLEMDFDPGPSGEAESGQELRDEGGSRGFMDVLKRYPVHHVVEVPSKPVKVTYSIPINPPENVESKPKASAMNVDNAVPSTSKGIIHYYSAPSTSRGIVKAAGDAPRKKCGGLMTHINVRGEHLVVRRTTSPCIASLPLNLHMSSGDIITAKEMVKRQEYEETHLAYQVSQGEKLDKQSLSSALYHLHMAKKFMSDEESELGDTDVVMHSVNNNEEATPESLPIAEAPQSMIWSEREACERQVTQIGTSACGATAVINVFNALGVPVNKENVSAAIGTRLRQNNAPIPRYLMSRAVAGCTAADLVSGLQKASDGQVTARFFHTHPERIMSLSHWLADWIDLGAVPILTLNLQAGADRDQMPDAWHHQMVFGVSPRGIFLCNPVECVKESVLWPRLTSPSVLYIKSKDVLLRYGTNIDLSPLMHVPDQRFITMNVLGQVSSVIREWRSTGWSELGIRTPHIRIPCAYQAGITIAALTGSEAHRRLMHMPQLNVLKDD